jgi:hypothetical protein
VGKQKTVTLPVPSVPPGWYEVTLTTSSQGQNLSTQKVNIVRLVDDDRQTPLDSRFGLIATDLSPDCWKELPDLVNDLGCGRVKLGVWSGVNDPQQTDSALGETMAKLADLHITPTACLLDLPRDLSERLDKTVGLAPYEANRPGMSWLRLLKAPDAAWQPQLEYLIARHANRVDRWQIGADGSDVFATKPGMREVYEKLRGKFSTLIGGAQVAMAWPAWGEIDAGNNSSIAMAVPSSVLPSEVPLYVQELKGGKDSRLSLSFQMLDRARYGRDVQLRDLAERVIYAMSAGVDSIDLPSPFITAESQGTAMEPLDLFVPMRSLLGAMSGSRYMGKVPIADGIEAFLFDHGGQGMMVLWNAGRSTGAQPLAVNLGDRPRLFTLWGDEVPLVRPVDDPSSGAVQLPVGRDPEFLINIDAALAQLRASVSLNQPLIESTYSAHVRHIKFTNTYSKAITGTLRLVPPAGWRITPSVHNFSLNAGETFDHDIDIEFPFNSAAGPQTIEAQFKIQADRKQSFQIPLGVKLGLSELGMQSLAIRDGADIVVQQIIQNYGDKPIDCTAFVLMPGQQRQERIIIGLAAGKSTIKRFRFANIKAGTNTKIRVGLKEMDGPRILNDEVTAN